MSISSVDSSACATSGVYCSSAIATACSASVSRSAVRSYSRASGMSMSTPPRRIPGCTPAARASGETASTRSCSSTTLPASLDQFGQKTSSGSWGRYRPIQRRMALQ